MPHAPCKMHIPPPPNEESTSPVQAGDPRLAWSCHPPHLPVKLMPADQFSLEELTHAYNQTRIDYIVPMPMNAARLQEYIRDYDVDLSASVVAVEEDQITGLAMLGVRPGHTWPTRLGVLPITRQRGAGRLMMEYLIATSRRLGARYMILEVIQGNAPAHNLFKKLGFQETRPLLILRRPPGPPAIPAAPYTVEILNRETLLDALKRRRSIPSWLDETPSLEKMGNLAGLRVDLENGGRGWLAYQNTVFQLRHLVLETEAGDPRQVGQALLHALHTRHPAQDTSTENVPADDPHLPAMLDLNYLESFGRIEMRLDLPG